MTTTKTTSSSSCSFRLRCTVSGGLEQFAYQEILSILLTTTIQQQHHDNNQEEDKQENDHNDNHGTTAATATTTRQQKQQPHCLTNNNTCKIKLDWHHRGHAGSQLDIIIIMGVDATNFSPRRDDSSSNDNDAVVVMSMKKNDEETTKSDDYFIFTTCRYNTTTNTLVVEEITTKLVCNLRYVEHISMLIFSTTTTAKQGCDVAVAVAGSTTTTTVVDDVTAVTTLLLLQNISNICQNQIDPSMLDTAIDIWRRIKLLWNNSNLRITSASTSSINNNNNNNRDDDEELGELLPTPSSSCFDEELHDVTTTVNTNNNKSTTTTTTTTIETETEEFHVNTIYTRQHVAKLVVSTFMNLVFEQQQKQKQKQEMMMDVVQDSHHGGKNEISSSSSSSSSKKKKKILWLDAGTGNGSLLNEFPTNDESYNFCIGVDLASAPSTPSSPPSSSSIANQNKPIVYYNTDFLKQVTPDWLLQKSTKVFKFKNKNKNSHQQQYYYDCLLCVISNPPFSVNTRGDYTIIGQFLLHASKILNAQYIGLIVPTNFVKVWKSVIHGLIQLIDDKDDDENNKDHENNNIRLLYRMVLPKDSFYDPSTMQNKNIQSHFLFFETIQQQRQQQQQRHLVQQQSSKASSTTQQPSSVNNNNVGVQVHPDSNTSSLLKIEDESTSSTEDPCAQQQQQQRLTTTPCIHIVSKRDKGHYSNISTAQMTSAVVQGFSKFIITEESSIQNKIQLATSQRSSNCIMMAQLDKHGVLELKIELTPTRQKPLSILNCNSKKLTSSSSGRGGGGHSLGYMSTSVKPPLARAMNTLATATTTTTTSIIMGTAITTRAPGSAAAISGNQHSMSSKIDNDVVVIVNTMCGEGTLEYESSENDDPDVVDLEDAGTTTTTTSSTTFRIVGDHNIRTLQKVQSSSNLPSRIDYVVWDAQRLPLRDGIVDSILGDLPYMGGSGGNNNNSKTKVHHEPSQAVASTTTSDSKVSSQHKQPPPQPFRALEYQLVLAEMARVLKSQSSSTKAVVAAARGGGGSNGRAVLVSPDSKALAFAVKKYAGSFKEEWQTKVNIGGIAGKLYTLRRKEPCWKDQNLWIINPSSQSTTKEDKDTTVVPNSADVATNPIDHSSILMEMARNACTQYSLSHKLELVESHQSISNHEEVAKSSCPPSTDRDRKNGSRNNSKDSSSSRSLISKVYLHDVYYCHKSNQRSHSYRFFFDPLVSNYQAKILERAIRSELVSNPIAGTKLR